MRTGNKNETPNWKPLAIAAIAIAAVVGFIAAPMEAYPWIAMGVFLGAMAVDEA